MKNALQNFTIVYQNREGLKLKVSSVQELVDDCQPKLLRFVKNHVQKEEEVAIAGHETIYRNDKASHSARITIAAKDTMKTITSK